MFKIYGVSEEKNSSPASTDNAQNEELSYSSPIEVDIGDQQDTDADIGQIAVDVLDMNNAIVIVAPVAGVDPASIDIGLARNILTISGQRIEPAIYNDTKRMLVEECFYGAFSRSIILPENLGFDKIKATVDLNVITINIPKLSLISKNIRINKPKD